MTSHDEIKQLLVGIKSAQDSVSGRFDALESSLQGLKADWTQTNESVDELFRRMAASEARRYLGGGER